MAASLGLPAVWTPAAARAPSQPAPQGHPQATEGLRVGGTGSGLEVLQHVATAQHLPLQRVPSLGSTGGIRALSAKLLDAAISGRRLKDDERRLGLVERELFVTALVWAVHAQVPVLGLSMSELVERYANVSRWPNGQPVRLVLRPEQDSDTRAMGAISSELAAALARAAARPGLKVAQTDDEALDDLERIPGSLGVTSLGMLASGRRHVHALAIDGVKPDLGTLTSGRYPHRKAFYLITRPDASPAVQAALATLADGSSVEHYGRQGCVITARG